MSVPDDVAGTRFRTGTLELPDAFIACQEREIKHTCSGVNQPVGGVRVEPLFPQFHTGSGHVCRERMHGERLYLTGHDQPVSCWLIKRDAPLSNQHRYFPLADRRHLYSHGISKNASCLAPDSLA